MRRDRVPKPAHIHHSSYSSQQKTTNNNFAPSDLIFANLIIQIPFIEITLIVLFYYYFKYVEVVLDGTLVFRWRSPYL